MAKKTKTSHLPAIPQVAGIRNYMLLCLAGLIYGIWRGRGLENGGVKMFLTMLALSVVGIALTTRTRKQLRDCIPLEEVCKALSLDERHARWFAATHEIEPRYNIGGKTLYRVEDFREAATLLRPTDCPQVLVQPSSSADQPDEVLVRPAESSGDEAS